MLIYKITNKINGKSYIGQTIQSLNKRWNQHVCDSKKRKKMIVSRYIAKYGVENFTIEEIGGANSQSELNYQEWLLIYKHDSLWPNGYNTIEGGGSKGRASKSTKKKLSNIAKSRKTNPKSRIVLDIKTGKKWDSCKEAAEFMGINRCTLSDYLHGKIHNKTNLRWYSEPDKFKKKIIVNKKVINMKTKEVFVSISEAARKNHINRVTLNYKLLNPNKNDTNFRYLNGSC